MEGICDRYTVWLHLILACGIFSEKITLSQVLARFIMPSCVVTVKKKKNNNNNNKKLYHKRNSS